jgi:hypothetical protein
LNADIVLSLEELKSICGYRGKRHPQARTLIAWLRNNGFQFKIGIDGYPIVSRGHYEAVMGGAPRARLRPELTTDRRTEPNLAALDDRKKPR